MRPKFDTVESWIDGHFYSLDFEWDAPRVLSRTLYVDGREVSTARTPELEYLERLATQRMTEGR